MQVRGGQRLHVDQLDQQDGGVLCECGITAYYLCLLHECTLGLAGQVVDILVEMFCFVESSMLLQRVDKM